MPTLRSQRGKPSKLKEEKDEEMPPPVAPTQTRTRSTRSKKVSKPKPEVVEEVDVSDASSASSSARSTRTRTRSKPLPIKEIPEPSPPSTRSTRSTRQKATTSKSSKTSEAEKPEKKTRAVLEEMNPIVQLSPLVVESKEKSSTRTAKKRGKGRPKKVKQPVIESTSDELSKEESDGEVADDNKVLSLEQLHRQHVVPIKTALEMGVCAAFSKCMTKIMDTSAEEKQEKEFQRLMSITEMRPPIAPPPKTKGRQKRARSPEKTPIKETKVPETFNFDKNVEGHVPPAKKKMIMDQPTPEREDVSDKPDEPIDEAHVFPQTTPKEREIVPNTTFSPELFDTPKSHAADETFTQDEKSKDELENHVLSPPSPESEPESSANTASSSALGKVSSLVNFFDKNKKDHDTTTKGNTNGSHKITKEDFSKTRSFSPDLQNSVNKTSVPGNVMDSTFVVSNPPPANTVPSSMMNVTVCMNKASSSPVVDALSNQEPLLKAIVPPPTFLQQTNTSRSMQDSPASRYLLKQPPSLDVVMEEDDDGKGSAKSHNSNKSDDKAQPKTNVKPAPKEKDKKKGSSSSASGSSSMKSATSQPCLLTKKLASSEPRYGSTGKLNTEPKGLTVLKEEDVGKGNTKSSSSTKSGKTQLQSNVKPALKEKDKKKDTSSSGSDSSSSSMKSATSEPGLLTKKLPTSATKAGCTGKLNLERQGLIAVKEDDDEGKESGKSDGSNKSDDKAQPKANVILASKDKKKGTSSSTSDSSSSMKSATSQGQPGLLTNKLPPYSASKNLPQYGSAGKLHEGGINPSKPLVEAEKRRQEHLNQKVEMSKKKNAEWAKKTENKRLEEERMLKEKLEEEKRLKEKLEEEKRLKEKKKVALPPLSATKSILKKPTPMVTVKTEGATGGLGFSKPKYHFGPSTKLTGPPSGMLPMSKNPFRLPTAPAPTDVDMEESFKSANNASGFLDQTVEGNLSSYDITMYEDLDENLTHRENKTVPKWASDKEALKIALFSMVYYQDYQHKLPGGFPKADKNFKLFPNRPGHH